MVETSLPQTYLSSCYGHKYQHFGFSALMSPKRDDPLLLGTLTILFWGDDLTLRASKKFHTRSFSRHGDKWTMLLMLTAASVQGACSARTLSFGFRSFFIRGRSLSPHCAYPAAPPHFPCGEPPNSTQPPLTLCTSRFCFSKTRTDQNLNLIFPLHRKLRLRPSEVESPCSK